MSHRSIEQVLTHLGAWVLDRPVPPELIGQCCDRLRPAPIGEELRAALRAHNQSRSELVEWHWDQRLGRADGWLWQNGVLQQFRWWRRDGRLVVRAQLRCTGQAPFSCSTEARLGVLRQEGCAGGGDVVLPEPVGGGTPDPAHEVLAGSVERVTFHNPGNGFCVLRIKAAFLRGSALTTAEGIEQEVFNGDLGTVDSIDPDASELSVLVDGRSVICLRAITHRTCGLQQGPVEKATRAATLAKDLQ